MPADGPAGGELTGELAAGRSRKAVLLVSTHDPESQLHGYRAMKAALWQLGYRCDFVTANLPDAARMRIEAVHADLFGTGRKVKPIRQPAVHASLGPIGRVANDAYCCYEHFKSDQPSLMLAHDHGALLFYCLEARRLGAAFSETHFILLSSGGTLRDMCSGKLEMRDPSALGLLAIEASVARMADMLLVPGLPIKEWLVEQHGAELAPRVQVVPQHLRPAVRADEPAPLAPRERLLVVLPTFPLHRNCTFLAACLLRDPGLANAFDRIVIFAGAEDPDDVKAFFQQRTLAVPHVLPWEVVAGAYGADPPAGSVAVFAPFGVDHRIGEDLLGALGTGSTLLLTTENVLARRLGDQAVCAVPSPDAMLAAMRDLPATAAPIPSQHALQRDANRLKELVATLEPDPVRPVGGAARRTVTVAILHFNRAALLRQAFQSCLEQTHAPIEILIVDDGSFEPEARRVLAELESTAGAIPVRVLRQPNRYLGAARNAAVKAARGDLVYLLDDDNLLKPDALELLVRAQHYSDVDFVGSLTDNFVGETVDEQSMRGRSLYLASDSGYALFRNSLLDGNALYRRAAFLRLGGNSEDYGVGKDDQEFFARALTRRCSLAVLPEAVVLKRISATRLRDTHVSSAAGHLRVMRAYWPALPPRLRPLLLAVQQEAESQFAALSDQLGWIDPRTGLNRASASGEIVGIYRDMLLAWFSTGSAEAALRSEQVIVTANDVIVYEGPTGNAREMFPDRLGRQSIGVPLASIAAALGTDGARHGRIMIEVRSAGGIGLGLRETIVGPTGRTAVRYVGNLEGRRDISIRGWVKRVGTQSRPLRVSVFVDGRYYRQLLADRPRVVVSLGETEVPFGFSSALEQQAIERPLKNDTTLEVLIAEAGVPVCRRELRIVDGRVEAVRATGRATIIPVEAAEDMPEEEGQPAGPDGQV